jgi:hypothetical protein
MLRMPAFSHGVSSFFWALGFAIFIWLGGSTVGFSGALSFVVACVSGAGIFLFVRICGEDDPTRS